MHYYEHDNANVHRGIHELSMRATKAYEGARRAGRKVHQRKRNPDEIIFTRGTTEGINLVAHSWAGNLKEGDMILLTEMEHHSNIVPWQLIAKCTGAQLAYVPVTGDEGLLDLDQLDRLLTTGVKLFAFTHASNTLGTVNPAKEFCAKARALGITTLVDAAQSIGHMPVDVQDIGCDFLAFSGHKMCGPTGIGVLYGREELLEKMPPWQGGGDMISSVDFFESNGTPCRTSSRPARRTSPAPSRCMRRWTISTHRPREHLRARSGAGRLCLRPPPRNSALAAVRTFHRAFRAGQFCPARSPCPRRGHVGGPSRPGAARRPSLQPAADAQAQGALDRAGELLFLQHDGRGRPHDRNPSPRGAFLFTQGGAVSPGRRSLGEGGSPPFVMTLEIEELYQEVILDHSRRPRNFGELPDAAVRVHGDNPACGDEIHLAVKFDEMELSEDIKFTGRGCAISQASASLMTMKLKGKSRAEVMEMLRAFRDLVTGEKSDAPKALGDLRVMSGVRKFPLRVKCAMLAWRAVEQALEHGAGEATISTEPD